MVPAKEVLVTPVVDAVQAILKQLDPLYDAAAGAPAAVDVTPLLDALRDMGLHNTVC